jgi:hypothetical protein
MTKAILFGAILAAVLFGAALNAGTAAAAPATKCAESYNPPSPEPKWVSIFGDSDNDPVTPTGISIEAPAGTTTCKGSMRTGIACDVKGPATVRLTIQDFVYYKVPAGRTGKLTIGKNGDVACVVQGAAAAADPRMNEPVPKEVLARVNEHAGMCKAQRGTISGGENYIRHADFNGDGKTDYLVVSGALRCSTASLYCGQLGCPVTAYVSQPNGSYKASLNLTALEAEVSQVNGRDIVIATGQTLLKTGLVPVTGRWAYAKGRWKRVK